MPANDKICEYCGDWASGCGHWITVESTIREKVSPIFQLYEISGAGNMTLLAIVEELMAKLLVERERRIELESRQNDPNYMASILGAIDAIVDQTERVELIDDIIHRMEFERRYNKLTEEQLIHMHSTTLSREIREKLDACESESKRDKMINELARALYFRRCAWIEYLNGTVDVPPLSGGWNDK